MQGLGVGLNEGEEVGIDGCGNEDEVIGVESAVAGEEGFEGLEAQRSA